MKIIVTESQHNKLKMKQWLLRRQELFMNEYNSHLEKLILVIMMTVKGISTW